MTRRDPDLTPRALRRSDVRRSSAVGHSASRLGSTRQDLAHTPPADASTRGGPDECFEQPGLPRTASASGAGAPGSVDRVRRLCRPNCPRRVRIPRRSSLRDRAGERPPDGAYGRLPVLWRDDCHRAAAAIGVAADHGSRNQTVFPAATWSVPHAPATVLINCRPRPDSARRAGWIARGTPSVSSSVTDT